MPLPPALLSVTRPDVGISVTNASMYADIKERLARGAPLANCCFADDDQIAACALCAFREAGNRIPQSIAIVGFHALPVGTYIDPPLTPKEYMGQMAVQRLHELIAHPDSHPIKIEISTTLQTRKSC